MKLRTVIYKEYRDSIIKNNNDIHNQDIYIKKYIEQSINYYSKRIETIKKNNNEVIGFEYTNFDLPEFWVNNDLNPYYLNFLNNKNINKIKLLKQVNENKIQDLKQIDLEPCFKVLKQPNSEENKYKKTKPILFFNISLITLLILFILFIILFFIIK